jgi:hypothetical protein
MCLETLLELLSPVKLPYPVIKPDYTKTVANTNLNKVFNDWFMNYNVLPGEFNYWRTSIKIEVFDSWPQWVYDKWPGQAWYLDQSAAMTYDDTDGRHLIIKAPFLNTGVMAHEQAHNSYALLTPEDKAQFAIDYKPLKTTDRLMKAVFPKVSTTTDDVESHSEIYRYLGNQMPQSLYKYYPKLLEV